MSDSNVSRRLLRVLLRDRNCIAAFVGAILILHGLDANLLTSIGVGWLIGWFVR